MKDEPVFGAGSASAKLSIQQAAYALLVLKVDNRIGDKAFDMWVPCRDAQLTSRCTDYLQEHRCLCYQVFKNLHAHKLHHACR